MAAVGYDPRFLGTEVVPPQAPAPGPDDDPALAEPGSDPIADDPALAERGGSDPIADDPLAELGGPDPESDPDGWDEEPCGPTVRSFRRGELVVRTVGCGLDPFSGTRWPVAFVVTRAGRTEATPLFMPSPGPPAPLRPFDVSVLAGQGAIGFVAEASDGGSPGGSSSDDLWVLTAQGARLHRLPLASFGMEGLGNEDEREGYVVGLDERRSTFEVTGPGAGRFVACERWTGTHARGSDRWRGIRRAAQLDLPVTFDPERGFAMSDEDRPALDTCARADSP